MLTTKQLEALSFQIGPPTNPGSVAYVDTRTFVRWVIGPDENKVPYYVIELTAITYTDSVTGEEFLMWSYCGDVAIWRDSKNGL